MTITGANPAAFGTHVSTYGNGHVAHYPCRDQAEANRYAARDPSGRFFAAGQPLPAKRGANRSVAVAAASLPTPNAEAAPRAEAAPTPVTSDPGRDDDPAAEAAAILGAYRSSQPSAFEARRAESQAERAVAQTTRRDAILTLPEAHGRRGLATFLAVQSDMDVEACRVTLSKAEIDEAEIEADAIIALRKSSGATRR